MTSKFDKISYLVLEPNSSCNLACVSCNRKDLEKRGLRHAKNLTRDELVTVLEQFKNCPVDTIKFEGLSEPMLHPKLDELTETLRGYFLDATIIIATNLNYALEKTRFVTTLPNVDVVYLSIDGTGSIFEKLRPGASYARVMKSLGDIERLVSAEERAKKIFINFTFSDENFFELPKIYELKDKFGLAGIRINLAQNWSSAKPNHYDFSETALSALRPYRQDLKGVGGWQYKNCFWVFEGVAIDVFGDVRPCIINTDVKPLGNVFRGRIENIYYSAPYQDMRKAILQNKAPLGCENCCYHRLSPVLASVLGEKYNNAPRDVRL